MCDRRFRQNAVAEIEDERTAAKVRHDIINLVIERRAAGKERQWIDITLNRHPRLQRIASNRPLEGPVNPNGANTCHFHIRQSHCAGAAWETDDFCVANLTPHALNNFLGWRNTPSLELLRPQHTGPGIENLDNFSSSFQLPDQIVDRSLHQPNDQLSKEDKDPISQK